METQTEDETVKDIKNVLETLGLPYRETMPGYFEVDIGAERNSAEIK